MNSSAKIEQNIMRYMIYMYIRMYILLHKHGKKETSNILKLGSFVLGTHEL